MVRQVFIKWIHLLPSDIFLVSVSTLNFWGDFHQSGTKLQSYINIGAAVMCRNVPNHNIHFAARMSPPSVLCLRWCWPPAPLSLLNIDPLSPSPRNSGQMRHSDIYRHQPFVTHKMMEYVQCWKSVIRLTLHALCRTPLLLAYKVSQDKSFVSAR